ncbi:LPXTG cell wall anchor domain-containing protein [Streptomyces sp. NPDC047821]|uniref:LPXTG cell wall anchor domain-containing protein n=1 Tax=Streptomyces sp. NPDC047821 TaxID=3365488 RepID=UPI00371A4308
MKLRRAMAVAAATAVIAPAAFLAAPAAYATDGTTSTTSTSGAAGETDGTTNDGATTTEDGTKTEDGATTTDGGTTAEDGTKTEDDASTTEDGTKTEDGATTEDGTGTKDDTATDGTETGAEDGAEKPDAETGKDEEEAGEDEEEVVEEDEIVEEELCKDSTVDVKLSNLPSKIVAGSGWKNFQLNVKNNSKQQIDEVVLAAYTAYEADIPGMEENPDYAGRLIEKYTKVEYKQPNGEWKSGANLSGQNFGFFFDVMNLKKDENRTIQLRISIDKAAPAGAAVGVAISSYFTEEDCYDDVETYPFEILAAGTSGGDGGEAKPSDEKPADLKPQGGSNPIKVTGELAETGSSSMLPTIGIAGGIAIVAGAGVVFALKRRSNGAAA